MDETKSSPPTRGDRNILSRLCPKFSDTISRGLFVLFTDNVYTVCDQNNTPHTRNTRSPLSLPVEEKSGGDRSCPESFQWQISQPSQRSVHTTDSRITTRSPARSPPTAYRNTRQASRCSRSRAAPLRASAALVRRSPSGCSNSRWPPTSAPARRSGARHAPTARRSRVHRSAYSRRSAIGR